MCRKQIKDLVPFHKLRVPQENRTKKDDPGPINQEQSAEENALAPSEHSHSLPELSIFFCGR